MTFDLPLPPTANHLFFNLPKGKGRARTEAYKSWVTQAGWEIARQRRSAGIAKCDGPVALLYEIKEGRRDLENHAKPVSDLLVSAGVIEDDGPKFVREIVLRWADVPGVRVTITPTEGQRNEPLVPILRRGT